MSKMLIFDMDGTIADLYNVENWLDKLRAEDDSPYSEAKPMYNMDVLRVILNIFKELGYTIAVVSWGAKGGSKEYTKRVKRAKILWLKHNDFPYDEVHVVKYGTPKQNFANADLSILIDDSEEVRQAFMKGTKSGDRQVIDANQNIVAKLIDMLVAL